MNYLKEFKAGMTYSAYKKLINDLLDDTKTTGADHSIDKLIHTRLCVSKMDRLEGKVEISEFLSKQVKRSGEQNWLIIAEAWDHDCANNLPAINALAQSSKKIKLRILLENEHPEIAKKHLTNDKAIPRLLILNADCTKVLGSWGPRPLELQRMVDKHLKRRKTIADSFRKDMQNWYTLNKFEEFQIDMINLFDEL